MTGVFITFEGVEGVGKTTQLQRLMGLLAEHQVPAILTREPGATAFGHQLRQIILDPSTRFHSPYTEIMLFMADRLEHLAAVVEPALASGKVVLCDRFVDSTIAYQVAGRGLPESFVASLHQLVTRVPNRTILLDVEPEEGIRRARGRAKLDRFEQETMAFHYRVREKYIDIAKRNPNRIIQIDTMHKTMDDVFNQILLALEPVLPPTLYNKY